MDDSQLKPTSKYNPDEVCPKCGFDVVSTTHDKNSWQQFEFLSRCCQRCGYSWNELPIDTK